MHDASSKLSQGSVKSTVSCGIGLCTAEIQAVARNVLEQHSVTFLNKERRLGTLCRLLFLFLRAFVKSINMQTIFELKIHQNVFAVGISPRTRLGSLQRSHRP